MATTVSAQVCSICGKPLGANGHCIVCLLSAGLDQEQIGSASQPDAFAFEGFEITRREDGSLWELGRGAMGVTYRALDKSLHRHVALKVIQMGTAGSRAVQERFLREARAAASLRHPNVAGVFHFGVLADCCYYAMELVDGETLETRVRREGPLPVPLVLEIAMQVTRALSAAAAQGLVHRDLKPGNIMLTADPVAPSGAQAKVIDFGLAKATADTLGEMDLTHGGFVGTPTFASPEQFDGAEVDPRSDIYSLGATLWYALTGFAPFSGRTIEAIRNYQKHVPLPVEQLRARKVPAPMIALLRGMLATDPAKRPASAREFMEKLESVRRKLTRRRVKVLSALALPLAAGVIAFTTFFASPFSKKKSPVSAVAEKSIAVLPLENLSGEKENAFFADGIQDDVLTSLAKINDLKVISRTSVMQYRSTGARNLRQIARELGVENVLEGSVRREGDRVLMNVQLINAREDRHIWAEHYDRAIADSVGLQGELATQVAAALKARLAPKERTLLETKPTHNPEAYTLYLKALGRERAINPSTEDTIAAKQLYTQAIALDPKFALAHARLSIAHSHLAANGPSDNIALRTKARAAAEEAFRLSPLLGEAHMALGLCLYWTDKDYAAALREFSIAAAISPNEPDILHYIAGIYRRQGRWRESLASDQRTQDLDPRNIRVITDAAINYLLVRDWPGAAACYNRALGVAPDSALAMTGLAYLEVVRNSNPAAGRRILQNIPAGIDPDGLVTLARWDLAMLARDYAAAEKIVTDFPLESFPNAGDAPKTYHLGRIALARGDVASAQRYFTAARPDIEGWVRDDPDDPDRHVQLASLYAYMRRKEDAIREARRAIEMEPENQNAFHGAARAGNLALICALTGETDEAIKLIERLLSTPGAVGGWPDFPSNITLADLRLRWEWDSLRSDPRFQKILAGPEPKTVY